MRLDDAIEQFRTAMIDAGLRPPERIEPDGRLHRFSTNGTRGDDAGWYVLHGDGVPAGAFGDWRTGTSKNWRANIGRDLSPQEVAAHRARIDAIRQEREEAEAKETVKTREKAAAIWQSAKPAGDDHPYLLRKGVKSHGLRGHAGALVVPVRDGAELHSLQFVHPDGEKRFLPGGRVRGCYFPIGEPDGVLCIAEGYATGASIREATGHAVAVAFNAGNLLPVARALRPKFPDLRLIVCADDDVATSGNPGLTHAREAARAVDADLAVPGFGDNRPDGATDFNDLHRHAGIEAVRECIQSAAPVASDAGSAFQGEDGADAGYREAPRDGDHAGGSVLSVENILHEAGLATLNEAASPDELERCIRKMATLAAGLDAIGLESLRVAAKRALATAGIRGAAKLVDAALDSDRSDTAEIKQGQPFAVEDPAPWPSVVDGAELLETIRGTIMRYVVIPEYAAVALALWIVHTHAIATAYISPILAITSPQKRCGKTTVLELLACMVNRRLPASNVSAAALFRAVEAYGPTLLVDEADTFLRDHEELRGVLNSGHTRASAQVVRTVGDDHEPRVFRTFTAKAIAAIGSLPGTIEDRAIIIRMHRRAPGEHVKRMRRDRIAAELAPLPRQARRWVADHAEVLRDADPATPESLHDRAADNWRPLLAIADAAEGKWPELARAAAVALSGAVDGEDTDAGVMLLADLRELFRRRAAEHLPSAVIVEHLLTLADRPWPTWQRGRPITERGIAKLLRPFGVRPKSVRVDDGKTRKGYDRSELVEPWRRYLPPEGGLASDTTAQTARATEQRASSSRHTEQNVPDENSRKPVWDRECDGVPDTEGGAPEEVERGEL